MSKMQTKIKRIKSELERFGRVNKEDIPFLINILNENISETTEEEYQIIMDAYEFLSLKNVNEDSIDKVYNYIHNNELVNISKSQIRTSLNSL